MAPLNPRKEADRLKEAKEAIDRMKRLRQKGKGNSAGVGEPGTPAGFADLLNALSSPTEPLEESKKPSSNVMKKLSNLGMKRKKIMTENGMDGPGTSKSVGSGNVEEARQAVKRTAEGRSKSSSVSGNMALKKVKSSSAVDVPKILSEADGAEPRLFCSPFDRRPNNESLKIHEVMSPSDMDYSPHITASSIGKVYVNKQRFNPAWSMELQNHANSSESYLPMNGDRKQSSHKSKPSRKERTKLKALTNDPELIEALAGNIPSSSKKSKKFKKNKGDVTENCHKVKKATMRKQEESVSLESKSNISSPLCSEVSLKDKKSIMKKQKKSKLKDELESINGSPLRPIQKIKKFLRLKMKKRHVSDGAKAPMSIKMTSAHVKGPVFVVSETDTRNGDVSANEISKPNSLAPTSNSSFSITTVPEVVIPTHSDVNCTSSSDEDDDWSDKIVAEEIEYDQHEDSDSEENLEKDTLHLTPDGDELCLNDKSKAEFHFINDQLILHLRHPTSFSFCGHVQVEVLKGAVEILGFLLTPSCGSQSILSQLKKPLLTMQTVASGKSSSNSPDLVKLIDEGSPNDAFILMRKANNTLLLLMEQYARINLLPHLATRLPKDNFEKADNFLQCITMPSSKQFVSCQQGETWDEDFQNISQEPGCTLLCGGKSVGKSTMLRYLVNRYLSISKQGVLVIDFDPGQAELTVPGCVSISVVKRPLLGPNFYNQQDPLKCIYVGEVNLVNCVSRYIDACAAIIHYWHSDEELRQMPCLVNTVGFTRGLGLTLMVQILSLLQPTCVIQIESSCAELNYPDRLSADLVKRGYCSSPFRLQLSVEGQPMPPLAGLNYDLRVVNSVVSGAQNARKRFNHAARFNRELAVLSYISKIVSPPSKSLLQVVPYCCPLNALYLCVGHESVSPSVILSTFNASMVALCCVDPEKENVLSASEPGLPSIIQGPLLGDCLGFGIVRGIDLDAGNLYLLTPVPTNVLESINCLALGAVCLPTSVYLTPPKGAGFVPYVVAKKDCSIPSIFRKSP